MSKFEILRFQTNLKCFVCFKNRMNNVFNGNFCKHLISSNSLWYLLHGNFHLRPFRYNFCFAKHKLNCFSGKNKVNLVQTKTTFVFEHRFFVNDELHFFFLYVNSAKL